MMKRFAIVAAVVAFPASALAQPALPPPPPPPAAPAPVTASASVSTAPATPSSSDSGSYGPHQGWLGISLGLPAGGAPTAGITYFVSDTGALKLDVGIDFGTKVTGGQSEFLPGFSAEVGYRAYIAKAGNLSPFVQPGAFFGRPAGGGDFASTFTMQFNVGLGAEYFFSDHLSVSGQTGVGVSFRNEFKAINLTTGTSGIYGNLYW